MRNLERSGAVAAIDVHKRIAGANNRRLVDILPRRAAVPDARAAGPARDDQLRSVRGAEAGVDAVVGADVPERRSENPTIAQYSASASSGSSAGRAR